MKINNRPFSLFLAVALVFGFSLVGTNAPAAAAPAPYITFHSFNLACQSDGTQIHHDVRFDMFLPAGYYLTWTNNEGDTVTNGPFGSDLTVIDSLWNDFLSASPYHEQSIIYDPSGTPVYEAGYAADCTGVANGDQANHTSWSNPTGAAVVSEVEPRPGPDMVAIPDYAVVGQFTQTTVALFAPRADAVSNTVIEQGNTLWVLGMDKSGQFYKVVLSGKYLWVPVSTIEPNFDAVWQGKPLPTTVVQ